MERIDRQQALGDISSTRQRLGQATNPSPGMSRQPGIGERKAKADARARYQFDATASDDDLEDELDENLDETLEVTKRLKGLATAMGGLVGLLIRLKIWSMVWQRIQRGLLGSGSAVYVSLYDCLCIYVCVMDLSNETGLWPRFATWAPRLH
jgi:hypothetical protein